MNRGLRIILIASHLSNSPLVSASRMMNELPVYTPDVLHIKNDLEQYCIESEYKDGRQLRRERRKSNRKK